MLRNFHEQVMNYQEKHLSVVTRITLAIVRSHDSSAKFGFDLPTTFAHEGRLQFSLPAVEAGGLVDFPLMETMLTKSLARLLACWFSELQHFTHGTCSIESRSKDYERRFGRDQ